MSSTAAPTVCRPRYCTPRTPSRRTRGGEVVRIMEMLGFDPMPWQREVLDLALEVDDDGRLVYREVVLVVPRQAGKSAMLLALVVWRALMWGRPQFSWSTMQTGAAARHTFVDKWLRTLKGPERAPTPFRGLFRERLALGSEAILWDNGSIHLIGAPTGDAGHGDSTDQALIDEAFALTDDRLEQGLKPTMITRESPQTWIVSAAGDDSSVYLKGKVEVGRERVRLGLTERSCYVEYSAPDDAPAEDPATWMLAHPAIGYTITVDAIAADFETMPLVEFERAYLARWPSRRHRRIVPEDAWDRRADARARHGDRLVLAVAVAPDRDRAAIVAASPLADGQVLVEVTSTPDGYDHRPGTGWVVPRLRALIDRHRPAAVAFDAGGPAKSLLPDLEAAGVQFVSLRKADAELDRRKTARGVALQMGDYAAACGAFFDDVVGDAPRLVHLGQEPLDDAVAAAGQRRLGQLWAWARATGEDITPLEAATIAAYVARALPEPKAPLDWTFIDV